jgi:3'-phosphoadenosine 5'-phosphosulfate sulfotransferase (PAPS reductase)/FAD synthetase
MEHLNVARTVCWFSAGAASAIATKLVLRDDPTAVVAYCETNSEHPDNARFVADCVRWFNAPVERLRSDTYTSTWDVWERRMYMAGNAGAPCTVELKVAPRLSWQKPTDVHVFGYTADANDVARATRLRETYFEMQIETPLIDRGITKAACIELIERVGIEVPAMYRLGFQNNNCIPCVKATSPNYWALVRREFPEQFERAAKLSRDLGARLCRINDERRFIDEIPADWPTTSPIQPSCDFMCHMAEQDLAA